MFGSIEKLFTEATLEVLLLSTQRKLAFYTEAQPLNFGVLEVRGYDLDTSEVR